MCVCLDIYIYFGSFFEVTENFYKSTTLLEQHNKKEKLQTLEALHIRNIHPKLHGMCVYIYIYI